MTEINDIIFKAYTLIELAKNNHYLSNINTDQSYNLLNEEYSKLLNKDKLDINIEDNKEFLYNWAKSLCRYTLLNILLNNLYLFLKGENKFPQKNVVVKDEFFLNNSEEIINIMGEEILNILMNFNFDKENVVYSSLPKEENDKYIKEFLNLFANEELLKIYEDIKKKGKIIYLNELDNEEKEQLLNKYHIENNDSNGCLCLDDDIIIILTRTNTIEDFPNFIHEFAHYVNMYYWGHEIEPTLREFYSILFERLAIKFLTSKGYKSNELNNYLYFRNENNLQLATASMPIFHYLNLYIKNGEIKEEDDINKRIESYNNLTFIKLESFDAAKEAHRACDYANQIMIANLTNILGVYYYIIGSYLSNKVLENNPDIINEIIKNMMSKEDIDPYDIFKLVGINMDNIKRTRLK